MKSIALALVLALSLSGCSTFSKENRSRRAYQKYVRKSSSGRQKQQSKFRSDKPSMPISRMPSEPVESTEMSPQAVPSEN